MSFKWFKGLTRSQSQSTQGIWLSMLECKKLSFNFVSRRSCFLLEKNSLKYIHSIGQMNESERSRDCSALRGIPLGRPGCAVWEKERILPYTTGGATRKVQYICIPTSARLHCIAK